MYKETGCGEETIRANDFTSSNADTGRDPCGPLYSKRFS